MSLTIIIVIFAILIVLVLVGILVARVDWRAWMIRRVGPTYKRGLAHTLIDGVWVYRESTLLYEGDDAMTYGRVTKIGGEKIQVDDIVPNAVGYDYDEYTGARVYRVKPGGCIGYSDSGGGPMVDYPQELISIHVQDRTVSNYCSSVNAESGANVKPWLVIGGIAIIAVVVVVLFMAGVIPNPMGTDPGAAITANVTTMEPITEPVITDISGPVGGK